MAARANKYGARRTRIGGETFDSEKEAARWIALRSLEKAGKIACLQRQVRFLVAPKTETERKCEYVADFCYERGGAKTIEDVKSEITRKKSDYVIKRKLVKAIYIDRAVKIDGFDAPKWDAFVET